MYINLRCSECQKVSPVSYGQLYSIWKAGYDQTPEDKREEVYLTTEIKCSCGNCERYASPMYQYTFGIIFHELKSSEGQ